MAIPTSPSAGARLLRRTDAKAMTARIVERENNIFKCFENTDSRVLFSGSVDSSGGLFFSSVEEHLLTGMHIWLSASKDMCTTVIAAIMANMISQFLDISFRKSLVMFRFSVPNAVNEKYVDIDIKGSESIDNITVIIVFLGFFWLVNNLGLGVFLVWEGWLAVGEVPVSVPFLGRNEVARTPKATAVGIAMFDIGVALVFLLETGLVHPPV